MPCMYLLNSFCAGDHPSLWDSVLPYCSSAQHLVVLVFFFMDLSILPLSALEIVWIQGLVHKSSLLGEVIEELGCTSGTAV